MYYYHLKLWLETFPMNQIYLVDSVAFQKDPVPALQNLETFLGIYPYFEDSQFYFNSTKGFYGLTQTGCLSKYKGLFHPKLTKTTIDALYAFYNEPNKKLMELTGVDFAWLHPKKIISTYLDPHTELQRGTFVADCPG